MATVVCKIPSDAVNVVGEVEELRIEMNGTREMEAFALGLGEASVAFLYFYPPPGERMFYNESVDSIVRKYGSGLKKLSFELMRVPEDMSRPLRTALAATRLETLVFSRCILPGLIWFVEPMMDARDVSLERCGLTPEDVGAICREAGRVETLDLRYNDLPRRASGPLIALVQRPGRIRTLDLIGNPKLNRDIIKYRLDQVDVRMDGGGVDAVLRTAGLFNR